MQGDRGCFEALNKRGLGSPNKIGGSTEPRFAHAFFVLCVWPAASRGQRIKKVVFGWMGNTRWF